METENYKMIRQAIVEYSSRTGSQKREIALIINPETELIHRIGGKLPARILGVEVVANDLIGKESFLLIPREEIDHADDLILQFGMDDHDEDEPINCGGCGHPITLELAGDLDSVTCPWCNKRNEIDY